MTAPPLRASPRSPAQARLLPAGRVGARRRPSRASERRPRPPPLREPGRFRPRSENPPAPPLPPGAVPPPRPPRGGVAIKGEVTAQGPKRHGTSAGRLEPEAPRSPRPPARRGSRPSALPRASRARGRGARAPPPPRTRTAVSPRRRRPPLGQLVRTHFDRRSHRDLQAAGRGRGGALAEWKQATCPAGSRGRAVRGLAQNFPEAAAGRPRAGAGLAPGLGSAWARALVRPRSCREETFQKNCLSLNRISVNQENLKHLP